MNKNYKNLIIAPHIDDDVLGCYSVMNKNSFIAYMGVEDRSYVKADERIEELKKVAEIKKFKWELFNNKVNCYIIQDLIPLLENLINTIKPQNIFIPHYSYNQDHKTVYDAAIVALRQHDINWFIKRVFVYEQPHTILWSYIDFNPNIFIQIDIEDKIRTYELYKSQVRSFRSSEIIKSIARIRGAQCNTDYAESFDCIRFFIDKNIF